MSKLDNGFSYKDGFSLKEFFLEKCRLHTEDFNDRFEARDKAVDLAFHALEKRLDGMNEIREQLRAQSGTFITRVEHDVLVKEIQELREARAKLEGKADQSSLNWTTGIAIAAVFIAALSVLVHWMK